MDKTTIAETGPSQNIDYEAEIDRYLAEMKQMYQPLAESQRNIERLRAETRAMLADIHIALDKLAAA